jgi:hypothetical protein
MKYIFLLKGEKSLSKEENGKEGRNGNEGGL